MQYNEESKDKVILEPSISLLAKISIIEQKYGINDIWFSKMNYRHTQHWLQSYTILYQVSLVDNGFEQCLFTTVGPLI